MRYFEEKVDFKNELNFENSDLRNAFNETSHETLVNLHGETLDAGIMVRLGNEPIVRNLKEMLEMSNRHLPPETEILFKKCDLYTIVHSVGALRVDGHAKVHELQYHAEVIAPDNNVQTIDLLPSTRFREVFHANVDFSGSVTASGNFGKEIPEAITSKLTDQFIHLGGDLKIQLASDANFIGKFTYSIKFPVVQSLGVASSKCSWVLNPDEEKTPLLGDQLLVQTIAVPKKTKKLQYNIHGVLKVDRGLFWREQTKSTEVYSIDVALQ